MPYQQYFLKMVFSYSDQGSDKNLSVTLSYADPQVDGDDVEEFMLYFGNIPGGPLRTLPGKLLEPVGAEVYRKDRNKFF
jgi:hypothetical protein